MIRSLYTALTGRSGKWPALRRMLIKEQPYCTCCGRRMLLTVHHVIPVSVDKSGELDVENCIVLCRVCHFVFGHFFNWRLFNPNVRYDVAHWRSRIVDAAANNDR